MAEEPLVEISELTVRREGHCLIDNVSLEVQAGSAHLLVGPNGAGKSTLFSAILGLVEFAGSIRCHFRKSGRIGYVPQGFQADRTLPLAVEEFLALPRQRRPVCLGVGKQGKRRADELLAQVGLQGFGPRPLHALSGGELQRVLLANALDPAPELLLLDEPSSGLDQTARQQLEDTLLAVRRSSGAAVLMVSHDLDQVRRIADHVTLLNRSVRRSGAPAAVLVDDLAASLALGTAP